MIIFSKAEQEYSRSDLTLQLIEGITENGDTLVVPSDCCDLLDLDCESEPEEEIAESEIIMFGRKAFIPNTQDELYPELVRRSPVAGRKHLRRKASVFAYNAKGNLEK